jgi:hypothetical protein
MSNLLINIVAFKIAWLSSVLGGAYGLPLLGPAAVVVAVMIHLHRVSDPSRELRLILITGVLGVAVDSIMISAGWLIYPTGTVITGLSPLWILGMWMLFATTFNISFRWMQSRIALAGVMGAVFGPLSYYSGAKLGAVSFGDTSSAMLALGVSWGLLLPGLLLIAKRLDGVSLRPAAKDPLMETSSS